MASEYGISALLVKYNISDVLGGTDPGFHQILSGTIQTKLSYQIDEYDILASYWTLILAQKHPSVHLPSPYLLASKLFTNTLFDPLLLIKSFSMSSYDLGAFVSTIKTGYLYLKSLFFIKDLLILLHIPQRISIGEIALASRRCFFLDQNILFSPYNRNLMFEDLSFYNLFVALLSLNHCASFGELDLFIIFSFFCKLVKRSLLINELVDQFNIHVENTTLLSDDNSDSFPAEIFDISRFINFLKPFERSDIFAKLSFDVYTQALCNDSPIFLHLLKHFCLRFPNESIKLSSPKFIKCLNDIPVLLSDLELFYDELVEKHSGQELQLHQSRLCMPTTELGLIIGPVLEIFSLYPYPDLKKDMLEKYFGIICDKWIWSLIFEMGALSNYFLKCLFERIKLRILFFFNHHSTSFPLTFRKLLWQIVLYSVTKAQDKLIHDGISIDVIIICSLYASCKLYEMASNLEHTNDTDINLYTMSFKCILSVYLLDPLTKECTFRSIPVKNLSNAHASLEVDIITFYNSVFLPVIQPLLLKTIEDRDKMYPEFSSLMECYIYPTRKLHNVVISHAYRPRSMPHNMKVLFRFENK